MAARNWVWRAAVPAGFFAGGWLVARFFSARRQRPTGERGHASSTDGGRSVGQWDIAPGETWLAGGQRDLVTEASMQSFPASDPPAIGHNGQ